MWGGADEHVDEHVQLIQEALGVSAEMENYARDIDLRKDAQFQSAHTPTPLAPTLGTPKHSLLASLLESSPMEPPPLEPATVPPSPTFANTTTVYMLPQCGTSMPVSLTPTGDNPIGWLQSWTGCIKAVCGTVRCNQLPLSVGRHW